MVEAVLGGGLGGPEQGVDAAGGGPLGRFGEGDGVDAGVEGASRVGVVERTARAVRGTESFLPAQDLEHDAAGGVQTAWWQPRGRLGCGDQGLGFRSRARGCWWWWLFSVTALGWMFGITDAAPS